MSLSKEQRRRVRKALLRRLSVQKLQTPLEVHYFAWHWNWDNGIKPLAWIVRQPDCDQGTALLIYWHASPTWYCQYQDRKEVRASGGNVEHYDLIKEIEKRVAEGYYTAQTIRFSPRDDSGHDRTADHADLVQKSSIPAFMLEASPGMELERNILTEFVQRELTAAEGKKANRKIASGLEILHALFPEVSEPSDPDRIVEAIGKYVTIEQQLIGHQVQFNSPSANVGWALARQIERKYGWSWRVYSWDSGDTERTGLMSPDQALIVDPANPVILSIKRDGSENAIGRFFALLGTYSRTQDFREFYALNWMTFVPERYRGA